MCLFYPHYYQHCLKNIEEKEQSTIFSSILLCVILQHVPSFRQSHHPAYIKYLQKECLHTIPQIFPPLNIVVIEYQVEYYQILTAPFSFLLVHHSGFSCLKSLPHAVPFGPSKKTGKVELATSVSGLC